MIDYNENSVSGVYSHYRERLKSQAKIISKELSIERNKAYDLLALLWGMESWRDLLKLLDKLEEIHRFACGVIPKSKEQADLLAGQLLAAQNFHQNNAEELGWHNLRYIRGIYSALTSSPKEKADGEILFSGTNSWYVDALWLLNMGLSVKTAWLHGRVFYSDAIEDHITSMLEYYEQAHASHVDYGLSNDEFYRTWELSVVINKMLGRDESLISLEKYVHEWTKTDEDDQYDDEPLQVEVEDTLLYNHMQPGCLYLISISDFAQQLKNTVIPDYNDEGIWFERPGLAEMFCHLPDNALCVIYRNNYDSEISLFEVLTEKEDLARLFAGNMNYITFMDILPRPPALPLEVIGSDPALAKRRDNMLSVGDYKEMEWLGIPPEMKKGLSFAAEGLQYPYPCDLCGTDVEDSDSLTYNDDLTALFCPACAGSPSQ